MNENEALIAQRVHAEAARKRAIEYLQNLEGETCAIVIITARVIQGTNEWESDGFSEGNEGVLDALMPMRFGDLFEEKSDGGVT